MEKVLIGSLLSILLSSLLFVLAGLLVYSSCIKEHSAHPFPMKAGLGYFLGMASFITVYRFFSICAGNAAAGFKLAFALLLLAGCFSAYRMRKQKIPGPLISGNLPGLAGGALAAAAFYFVFLAFWLAPVPQDHAAALRNPFYSLGSLHSVRYAEIAEYAVSVEQIPTVGQNFGQSLLATIPSFLGFPSPFFALNFWLYLSLVFLTAAIYGLFRYFKLTPAAALLGTFVVMAGNTALSLAHVLVIDSGSPPMLLGYTDSVFSLGSILFFLVWFYEELWLETGTLSLKRSGVLLVVLGAAWNYSAVQNIFLTLGLMALAAAYSCFKKHRACKKILTAACVLVLAGAFGAAQGGMLTPKKLWTKNMSGRTGMMAVDKADLFAFRLGALGLTYHYLSGGEWVKQYEMYTEKMPKLVVVEARLWETLRIVFYPVAGLLLLGLYLKARGALPQAGTDSLVYFWLASTVLFCLGFAAAFFLMTERKWELSRFLMPGYLLGMMALVITLAEHGKNDWQAKRYWPALVCLGLLITIGPVRHGLSRIAENLSYHEGCLDLKSEFKLLLAYEGGAPEGDAGRR